MGIPLYFKAEPAMKKILPNTLQALILDMDGVLVDTEPLHIEAFIRYMKSLGLQFDPGYVHGFVGYSIDENVRRINREFLAGREIPVAQGVRQRDAIYLDLIRNSRLQPLRGIREIADLAEEKGWQLALASSSSREQIQCILENLEQNGSALGEKFTAIVSGEDVALPKPDAAIYRLALQKLNCRPAQALAVEDSEAGVRSAKANGIACVALASPYMSPERLRKADVVVDSLTEAIEYLREVK